MAANRIVPCIWLDDQAEAAASSYAAAFPDGRVDAVARYPRSGAARDRVFFAFLPMRRMDVGTLERATEGG